MHPGKVLSQAKTCADATADVLWETLAGRRPADRCLGALLRRNRHFGGRDRRLLSETVFACLRWWGWIEPLAPSVFLKAVAATDPGYDPGPRPAIDPWEWALLLTAAHALEGGDMPTAVQLWAQRANLPDITAGPRPADTSLAATRARLGALVGNADLPALEALLPTWVPEHLAACPCPYIEVLEWQQRRPPLWLRTQTDDLDALCEELTREGLQIRRHDTMRQALCLREARVNLRTLAAFRRGAFEIQDLASQAIGVICRPEPGERWWDACAGAGGKALHLADLMQRKGSITASDRRVFKLDELRLRARRASFPNIRTREWKGKALPERRGGFDGVLVDAPCTCSGTWRRNPDGRWTTTAADVNDVVDLQRQLLGNAAVAVKPGGVLVYATCSFFERENLGAVEHFLAENTHFRLEPFIEPLSGNDVQGTLQIWPWHGDCDAMFAARFRRQL